MIFIRCYYLVSTYRVLFCTAILKPVLNHSCFFQVSWFRRQNSSLSVLTIGRDTFSADLRYSMDLEKPSNWRLRIRPTMAVDDGTYLCQISTHPPTILVTNLKVIGTVFLYKMFNQNLPKVVFKGFRGKIRIFFNFIQFLKYGKTLRDLVVTGRYVDP